MVSVHNRWTLTNARGEVLKHRPVAQAKIWSDFVTADAAESGKMVGPRD
jgi:hypothetical protein